MQSSQTPTRREGALIVLTAKRTGGAQEVEAIGVGEIAPLPGLHAETLAQAEEQTRSIVVEVLQKALQNLDNTNLTNHEAQKFAEMQRLFSGLFLEATPLYPSARCGVEMALWSLWARIRGTGENIVFPGDRQSSARGGGQPINALIAGDDNEASLVRRAEKAVREGYRTLKIKVGRREPEREAAQTRAIRRALGKDVALRLDANRSWSLETATRFGETVADCAIEYIEEPLRNFMDIPRFAEQTGVKVALDETLYASPDLAARRFDLPDEALGAYVLKPAAIGGIWRASELAREAATRGLRAVVSSVFESGVALGFYAALQSSWNAGDAVACGLDTFQALGEDVIAPRFRAERGFAPLPQAFDNAANLRFERLECVFRRDIG
jgi:O-succinylbenzoate synthase